MPFAAWKSRELDCYIGQYDSFILPGCFLWKVSKGKRTAFELFKPNEKYVFAPSGAGEVTTQLCARKQIPEAKAPPAKKPVKPEEPVPSPVLPEVGPVLPSYPKEDLVSKMRELTPPPLFEEPQVRNEGIVFDKLPENGVLMVR